MKSLLHVLIFIVAGVTGIGMIFAESENLVLLLLSKPLGIALLMASFRSYNRLTKSLNQIITTSKRK